MEDNILMEANIQTINNTQTTDNTEIVTEFITKAQAEQRAVRDYCESFPDQKEIDLVWAEGCILRLTYLYFNMHNENAPKDEKWYKSHKLEPHMIADILLRKYAIRNIDLGGGTDVLAIYADDGTHAGTYVLDPDCPRYLTGIINRVSPSIDDKRIKEVRSKLESEAPCVEISRDPDLIAVNNGIFDYKNKKLLPFSPDHIFVGKLATAYRDHPENPMIHNDKDGTDWDVESWMASLSDDPAIVDLLWSVGNAVVRPLIKWEKMIILSGTSGCNGKGTFCELVRNLCGEKYWLSLSIHDCAARFLPFELVSKKTIITDENAVGDYIDMPEKLKEMITGDVISLEAKNKDRISVRFRGVIIQCINDYVRIRDRTESMYRRLLMVPFLKRFIGTKRKYIKDDYLRRPEVLEYVLWRVLNMPEFDKLPEPEACRIELEKYKESNDPLRAFLAEILPELAWSTVPFLFLYDLYKEWIKRNNPSGKMPGKGTFEDDLMEIINTDRSNDCYVAWEVVAKTTPRRIPQGNQNIPEPLIKEYNLTNWMNPYCTNSNDVNKLCVPNVEKNYRGSIKRIETK